MQLRLNRKQDRSFTNKKFFIKAILIAFVFVLAIFLLDKIEVKIPDQLIKQEISNDKIITLK